MDDTLPLVLLVDDSNQILTIYREYLRDEPYRLLQAKTGRAALTLMSRQTPQAMLLDLNLPDTHGLEILEQLRNQGSGCAVVVVSAHGSVDMAVQAMRLGAFDFLEKPFTHERLLITLRNALEKQRLASLVESYQNHERLNQYGFIGESLPMQAIYRTIARAAGSKATVFITGESGTGKELCAEAVHRQSPRVDQPFIPINCAAIPRELIESELFGHVKGAFTGAHIGRQGAVKRADGGTLFLDEIGELNPDLQTKLLRFLQTNSFTPVGSDVPEQVDVRIICATNRDAMKEVEAGHLREDLYYRLHVVPVHMPPLRERGRDILLLATRFLREFAREEEKKFERFSPEAEAVLKSYKWPGNVRELQNVIRNVVVLHQATVVTVAMLPIMLERPAQPSPSVPASIEMPVQPLWQTEKQAIERAISACHGNIPRAAALLEVSPSTVYRKLKNWEGSAVTGRNPHSL